MSASNVVGVYIFIICVIVPVLVYALVMQLWNAPLQNGPGYFLGIEVPAGFYEGPGRRWMTGFHGMVVALYGVCGVGLAAIIATRRWEMTPLWAGGFALVFVPAIFGFQAWTRHKLGVNPPVRPVALALESRRMSDYISWPTEALAVALVGLSWWLLLHGGRHFDWRSALLQSWAVLGIIPGKMAMVRVSWPLSAERTEEHFRLQEASRRFWIRLFGIIFQWFFLVVLLGVAVLHGLLPVPPAPVWRWLVPACSIAVWGYGMIVMFCGMSQLKAMGRNLRPSGSWKTPFGRASCFGTGRAFYIWFAIWFGGILAFILYPLCKAWFK
ncbi:MAG TPA: hypothetical protein VMQ60_06840 [Acidobacteriaceae bacterium]|jgi:hypothetical protein|nr:hypothetical protein [Acidobacteriaceae bacterium]